MGEKRFIRLTDISAYYAKESIESQIDGIFHLWRMWLCRKGFQHYIFTYIGEEYVDFNRFELL